MRDGDLVQSDCGESARQRRTSFCSRQVHAGDRLLIRCLAPLEGLCKAFRQEWFTERRSAILIVPSIPARIERNILIKPQHPDAAKITHDLSESIWWDERLYG